MPWILPTSCLETIDKNAARHRDGLRFLEMFHVKQMGPLGGPLSEAMHSEHDLKERSDAQIIVSRFPCGAQPFYTTLGTKGRRPDGCHMPLCAAGGIKKWRRRRPTSPAQRYYITPEGGALNPPVRRSRSQAEPWQPRAERPGGWLNPHARKGVSTFGNTGKHRLDPDL